MTYYVVPVKIVIYGDIEVEANDSISATKEARAHCIRKDFARHPERLPMNSGALTLGDPTEYVYDRDDDGDDDDEPGTYDWPTLQEATES